MRDLTSQQQADELLAQYRKEKVPARYMLPGDRTGSGETVVWVGIGVRTPRGKVEVLLENNGSRRLAIWGASTLINVRRAAKENADA